MSPAQWKKVQPTLSAALGTYLAHNSTRFEQEYGRDIKKGKLSADKSWKKALPKALAAGDKDAAQRALTAAILHTFKKDKTDLVEFTGEGDHVKWTSADKKSQFRQVAEALIDSEYARWQLRQKKLKPHKN